MVNGYCDEKFSEAREVFSESINTGFELGAAISLEIEGETVLDLWGGVDSPSKGTEWQENTIVNVLLSPGFRVCSVKQKHSVLTK